ncbi:MAG: EAL domain-containing protein [Lachnospiraceae bacterium]|nr:EAL domain-containing protein [Lachnospiraceae bacterium]
MASQKMAIFMKWIENPEQTAEMNRILESAEKAGIETAILPIEGELQNISLKDMLQEARDQMELDPRSRMERRIGALSGEEKERLGVVRKILDENLLTYYFQPIVSAETGDIYGYEALMRPSDPDLDVTPYDILRYAELLNRLGDVERYTFLNVAKIMTENERRFGHRVVFINSIPGAPMLAEDYLEIDNALWTHAGHIVVEMTEQTEAGEQKIRALKHRFEQMGVPIALDDYGTGYSNIFNLLEYMPKFVKIDRSLISDIHGSPKKKRFVREIIEFCHDNDILTLAEGVETWQELRSVIRMGVDLIQGYYTGRPGPDITGLIDLDIKREIARYQKERLAGRKENVYLPDETGRVQLNYVEKSSFNCILVGKEGTGCGDVVIAGIPHFKTNTHLIVAAGYKGRITLENASFAGNGGPCIDIGENAEVQLELIGGTYLNKGGIRIPGSSKLMICGNGNMEIYLEDRECFGIGNDMSSTHGDILLDQDGLITIEANGTNGICIGSGFGGHISIRRGKYDLSANCDLGICIGAFTGDTTISMSDCDTDMTLAVTRGIGIGTLDGDLDLLLHNSSVKCRAEATHAVAYGSLGTRMSRVNVHDASLITDLRGEVIIGIGAKDGHTELHVERATVRIVENGYKALAFGGFNEDTDVYMEDCDTGVEVNTASQTDTMCRPERFKIKHGRNRFLVNGNSVEHPRFE